MKVDQLKIGKMYKSRIHHMVYDSPFVWESQFICDIQRSDAFVVLDIPLEGKRLKVLTSSGVVGYLMVAINEYFEQITK